MIQIRNVQKWFGKQQVLRGVNLNIARGETMAIVGPSGTGKSVLLKLIISLLTPEAGEVLIDGESITHAPTSAERNRICSRMGVLFQAAALFDSMTLLENVAFPLRFRDKVPDKEAAERSYRCLEMVGLSGYERRLPGEVSIGMRKRVGIARALVTDPDVLLFDEPNTGLDPQRGQEIYDLIREFEERLNFTGIVISHEIPEVFQVCDRVVMLYDGLVQHDGSVEDFLKSDNAYVQQFVKGEVEGPIAFNSRMGN